MAYRVKVYDTKIAGLFSPGGDAWEKTKSITGEIKAMSIAKAPKRTGELARKHGYGVQPTGLFGCLGQVYNNADHARYVHEGTSGPIVARYSEFLHIRPMPHSRFATKKLLPSVSGQRAQPWISQSAKLVLSMHRLL